MKITDLKIYSIEGKLKEPFWWGNGGNSKRTATLVKIETDEGIHGWGEGWAGAELIENSLKNIVIGKNPLLREKLWAEMFNELIFPFIGIVISSSQYFLMTGLIPSPSLPKTNPIFPFKSN